MSMPQRLIGFLEPTIRATNEQEAEVLALLRDRHLHLHRVHPGAPTIRISGPGVFLVVEGLSAVTLERLGPQPRRR